MPRTTFYSDVAVRTNWVDTSVPCTWLVQFTDRTCSGWSGCKLSKTWFPGLSHIHPRPSTQACIQSIYVLRKPHGKLCKKKRHQAWPEKSCTTIHAKQLSDSKSKSNLSAGWILWKTWSLHWISIDVEVLEEGIISEPILSFYSENMWGTHFIAITPL